MSTTEAPREQEQIVGVITGVVQKGPDKWQAVVQPDGSQYTKNLWTKDGALVSTLSGLIGTRAAFLCNVSHWTNAQNQPIRSLWIDAAGPPTVGSPAMAGPPQAQPQQQGGWQQAGPPQQTALDPTAAQPPSQSAVIQANVQPMGDLREQKIHRQTASKVAAILLTNLPQEERTMSTLLTLSERLVAYYDTGLSQAETLDDLMQRAMPASVDGPPPPGDDDIPF